VCNARFYVESWSASCHWCNNIEFEFEFEFEFELRSFHLSFTGNWNVERTQNALRTHIDTDLKLGCWVECPPGVEMARSALYGSEFCTEQLEQLPLYPTE
jgi:hypothetical protein